MNSQCCRKNDNKINTRKMKANATVRHQGISLTDGFITNISTVTIIPVL